MLRNFFIWWGSNIAALAAAEYLLPGIDYKGSFGVLIIAALVFGLINVFVKPILVILSVPAMIFTLGFFYLVVNALTFWIITAVVPGFSINGFWPAFFGAIIVSVVNSVIGIALKKD